MITAASMPLMVATAPTERSIPPPTTAKNWAADAIPTKVAPLRVSTTTGSARNVPERVEPTVISTARRTHGRRVRGWRRTHSPRARNPGLTSRSCPTCTLILGSSFVARVSLDRLVASARLVLPLSAEHREPQDSLFAEVLRLERARDLSIAHDDDPVAHGKHLGKLRGDEQNASAP